MTTIFAQTVLRRSTNAKSKLEDSITWKVGLLLAGAATLSLTGLWSLVHGGEYGETLPPDDGVTSSPYVAGAESRGWIVAWDSDDRIRLATGTPTASPIEEDVLPVAQPVPSQEPVISLSEVEQAICDAGWPDCAKALRVARCESGDDYSAPYIGGAHVGPFQIAVAYHAEKFAKHGWDIYVDGNDPYKNSVVALEIQSRQGWAPWPVCGYR